MLKSSLIGQKRSHVIDHHFLKLFYFSEMGKQRDVFKDEIRNLKNEIKTSENKNEVHLDIPLLKSMTARLLHQHCHVWAL